MLWLLPAAAALVGLVDPGLVGERGLTKRLVLELKDRLPRPQIAAAVAGVSVSEPPPLRDDVLSALVNLGYHRPLAEKAVDAAFNTLGPGADRGFERLLKQALRELSK